MIEFDEYGATMWVPQSHIHDDSDVSKKGDVGEIVISRWLANQKDLL